MQSSQIPILNLAVDTMDLLNQKGNLSLTEIVKTLDKPKTSVYRVLKTLEQQKWLVYMEDLKTYQVSNGFIRYAKPKTLNQMVTSFNLLVTKWQEKIHETIQLAVNESLSIFFVAVSHPNNSVIPNTYIGKHAPLHATAAGKLFLAYDDRLLQKATSQGLVSKSENTITSIDKLNKNLIDIRNKGYATTQEEVAENLCCLAIPILDYKDEICAAIDVCIPTKKITKTKIKKYLPELKKMKYELEQII